MTTTPSPNGKNGSGQPPASPLDHRHDVLCISSIDWDFIWQGHQEIMSTLAAQGHRVLFLENTGVRSPKFRDLPRLRQRLMITGRHQHAIDTIVDDRLGGARQA